MSNADTATRTNGSHAAASVFKMAQPTRHVHALRPHPDNPREEISRDDPKIQEMADSIIKHGIIEPLVITPDNFIVAGHRRRMASLVAFEKTKNDDYLVVPVTLREIEPEAALEVMLQENMQRASLTPLEEARAMYSIMDRRKLTVGDLAREIAIPVVTVSARLAILKCEPHVQRLYAANELPLNAAPVLARIPNAEKQLQYAGMVARRELTLPKLKDLMAEELGKGAPKELRTGAGGNFQANADETAEAYPRPAPLKRKRGGPPGPLEKGPITRASAVAALDTVMKGRISIVAVRSILESQCCACGMKGEAEVCQSCPLPRLISGIAGRAEV